MENLTGSKQLDELVKKTFPEGLNMNLSLEEHYLIMAIRDKTTTNIEIKSKAGKITSINETIHFDTHKKNAERILTEYQYNGEVIFTPRSKNMYHVKITYRSK
jgi:hypothetical protein